MQLPEAEARARTAYAEVTDEAVVAGIINTYRDEPGNLLPVMLDINRHFNWLPRPALEHVSDELKIPLTEILRVASFYNAFSLTPGARTSSMSAWAPVASSKARPASWSGMERKLGIKHGETTEDMMFTLEVVRCIGCCALAPAIRVGEATFGRVNPDQVSKIIDSYIRNGQLMKITNLEQLKDIKEQGLRLTYPDKIKIMVGMATCGISAGADKVYAALAKKIDELGLDVALTKTGCIGFCQREPLVDVIYPKKVRLTYQAMTPESADALVEALKEGRIYEDQTLCRIDQEDFLVEGVVRPYANPHPPELPPEFPKYEDLPFFSKQVKISLRNCGFINPESIEEYIARGGYQALCKALTDMTPEDGDCRGQGLRPAGPGRRRLSHRAQMGILPECPGRRQVRHLQCR